MRHVGFTRRDGWWLVQAGRWSFVYDSEPDTGFRMFSERQGWTKVRRFGKFRLVHRRKRQRR